MFDPDLKKNLVLAFISIIGIILVLHFLQYITS